MIVKLVTIILALILHVNCNLTQEESTKLQEFLSSLSSDKIPNKFKQAKDNTHWCCKIDVPPTHYEKTRVITSQVIRSQRYKCGSHRCGFLGLFKCTNWCIRYWPETLYHMDTFTVYQEQQCPNDHLICCYNHFLINGHCFDINEIYSSTDLLLAAQLHGIVLPPQQIGK